MKIKINEKDLELVYTMRIFTLYEEIMGRSLAQNDMTGYTTLMKLFYCAVLASSKKAKTQLDMTYDQFLDWLDDNGSLGLVNDFGQWFADKILVSSSLKDMMAKSNTEVQSNNKESKNA